METLYSVFPNPDDLLRLRPEDLAPILLRLALKQLQPSGFWPDAVAQGSVVDGREGRDYPFHKKQAVAEHVSRAWNWCERSGLIEPSSGMNGQTGWKVFTETGDAVARGIKDLAQVRAAAEFPKELLHPTIREKGWRAIVNSAVAGESDELPDVVRSAFAALEEAVRTAGKFTREDIGVDLMRRAFNAETGPLRDQDGTKPKAEREALGHLFAGAFAAFRGGIAHGTPKLAPVDARDQLLLASHLLRIIDARRPI